MLKYKTEPSVRNSKRKTHRLVAEISWRPNVVWRNKRRWTKQGITHLSPVVYTAAKCSTAGFPSVFSTWMLINIIFVYINNSDEIETMLELDSFIVVNGMCDFFAELDSKFWILKESGGFFVYFFRFSQCNGYRHDIFLSFVCIINTFSIIFLDLDQGSANFNQRVTLNLVYIITFKWSIEILVSQCFDVHQKMWISSF